MVCPEGAVGWIETAFGECIVTARDKWSFWVGMFSNLIWLVSSTPQYIQNCKTKKVEGQSPFFFSLLFTGNVCSLIGLLVNGGLITQVIQSIIYCILDGILFAQYLYYRFIYGKCCGEKNYEAEQEIVNEEREESVGPAMSIATGVAAVVAAANVDYASPYTGKNLCGTLFGWVSSSIYIISRLPQMMKNIKQRKVIDLSPLYSLFAVLGNATYLASLWIKDTSAQFNWDQAPWIVGAGGPMLCDITFLIQMAVWGIQKEEMPATSASSEEETEDEAESTVRRLTEL